MIGSPQDLLVIAVVGFLLFGSKKLPEMARAVGTSINEFKKVVNGQEEGKEGEKTAENAEAKTATAVAEKPEAKTEEKKKA